MTTYTPKVVDATPNDLKARAEMKLKISDINDSLLSLVVHDCVTIKPPFINLDMPITVNEPGHGYMYSLNIINVLNRLSYPYVVRRAEKYIGEEGTLIISEFMHYGKMTRNDMIKINASITVSGFNTLIANNIIVKCQSLPGPVEFSEENDKDKKKDKKRKRKEKNVGNVIDEGEWKVDDDFISNNGVVDDYDITDVSDVANGNKIYDYSGDAMYKIGWDEIIQHRQFEVIVNFIKERFDIDAAAIVKVLLDGSISPIRVDTDAIKTYNFKYSDVFSKVANVSNISEEISTLIQSELSWRERMENFNGIVALQNHTANIDTSKIKQKILDILSDPVTILKEEKDANKRSYYKVNITACLTSIREQTMYEIAVKRYDLTTGRIIRLLMDGNYLDQQKVSDMAIIPPKEARQKLYTLYKDKWIDHVEISKRADYNSASTYYFWYFNINFALKHLCDKCYKAIFNINVRQNVESNRAKIHDNNNNLTKMNQIFDQTIQNIDKTLLSIDFSRSRFLIPLHKNNEDL